MRKLALNDEILLSIQQPARYIGGEVNMVNKDPKKVDIRFAMCFPDVYEIGMSHLGIQILYDMFNRRDDVYCERVYSPWTDLDKLMREKNIPLFAVESQDPVKDFPLDSKEVMSLFQNTSALGIEPEDIGGCKLGALGIPEFGTDFAMQMLIDAQPKYFSDLVRISGLSHGTDVWLGNAQTLIQEGKATIQTAICTRDDIMVYLIGMGLEEGLAFTIMESVRKGKGLKDEWIKEMTDHGVPDWYIWSCKKIKYMFPKAHAAAYVMMAWRIAWFKVNYPLEYYTAFFSIRADDFSYEMMCFGKERVLFHINEISKVDKNKRSAKDEGKLKDLKIVLEMYARGYDFVPIDIYKAKADRFQIIDGKIMPSFASIEGMGEKAAQQLYEAAQKGPFLSKEEIDRKSVV